MLLHWSRAALEKPKNVMPARSPDFACSVINFTSSESLDNSTTKPPYAGKPKIGAAAQNLVESLANGVTWLPRNPSTHDLFQKPHGNSSYIDQK